MNIKKINTIRTRKIRDDEKNGKTGLFMTSDELDKMDEKGKIAYRFEVFGGEYAYLEEEVHGNFDYVMEMYYSTIDDWKRIRPDIKTIYILPTDIDIAIQKIKNRNLSNEKEIERIEETKEQYNNFMSDEDLRKKFDYCVYNNYDKESEEQILNIIKKIKKGDKDANLLFS